MKSNRILSINIDSSRMPVERRSRVEKWRRHRRRRGRDYIVPLRFELRMRERDLYAKWTASGTVYFSFVVKKRRKSSLSLRYHQIIRSSSFRANISKLVNERKIKEGKKSVVLWRSELLLLIWKIMNPDRKIIA